MNTNEMAINKRTAPLMFWNADVQTEAGLKAASDKLDSMHQPTPGPLLALTAVDGETWQCRVGNASGRVTSYWPTKQAASAEAARLRALMGGTSCVHRISTLRTGASL